MVMFLLFLVRDFCQRTMNGEASAIELQVFTGQLFSQVAIDIQRLLLTGSEGGFTMSFVICQVIIPSA